MVTFGEIEGQPEGSEYKSRIEVKQAKLHRHTVAGISGKAKEGADAIVLNQGYVDDEDDGYTIIYTGEGGREEGKKVHTKDQNMTKGNEALETSMNEGRLIRVIRGPKLKSPYAPKDCYRYDGLYFIERFWIEKGRDDFNIIRYKLNKSDEKSFPDSNKKLPVVDTQKPKTGTYFVTRIIRDTKISIEVKKKYEDHCQVCRVALQTGRGKTFSEGAHIRPLGSGHNGDDTEDNILCLCPNHHALFDRGGFIIKNDFSIVPMGGKLHVKSDHRINLDNLQYHRGMHPYINVRGGMDTCSID